MAPTFLQKLAKAASPNSNQTRDRIASDSSVQKSGGRLSIGRNRTPSVSIKSTSGSNASNTNISKTDNADSSKQHIVEPSDDIPSISVVASPSSTDDHVVEHQGSFDTVSTQPNVTIVPPSPLVGAKELDSDSEDPHPAQDTIIPPVATGVPSRTTTTTSPKTAIQAPSEELDENAIPTPTQDIQTPISPVSPAPTITPTKSAADVKDKDKKTNKMSTANSVPLREKASNKSLKSGKKTPPVDLHTNPVPIPAHHRAATAPAGAIFPSPNGRPESDGGLMNPIAESPTELRGSFIKSDSQNSAEFAMELSSSPKKGLGVLQPDQTGSFLSLSGSGAPDGTKGNKRPWKRSTTRKPTGLASAIAASGLAIANPTLSPSHSAQAAAQISPPISTTSSSGQKSSKSGGNFLNGSAPGSPPYLSKSPAQSALSHRSWQEKGKKLNADLSPKLGKSGTRQGRTRRTSRATSAKSDAGASEHGPSNSNATTGASVNGDESFTRPDYYSALELDADSSPEDMSGSDLSGVEDEYGDDLIPVTGFAVASTKRNQDFHEMFPTVPEGDYLIEDYGCALQREILIQGRLYISENHICFHANIFGWITDLSIPVYEIKTLEKKMTAFVIPNAIQIITRQAKYTFTSFLSRDTTFDVMHNIWRLGRPEDSMSMMSGSGRGSMDGAPASVTGENVDAVPVAAPAKVAAKKATMCACGKEGKHYSETAMDAIIPGTPEKINNMMFASGFIKEFLSENQKLLDIQMSDWAPVSPASKLLTQNLTYIKPLAGSLGPKQTKCEIKHEMVDCDFEEFISTVTTTRTPDVPSGGVFAVKTRTCVMWASPVSSRVIITSQVEWSGRSFIKGIIEKSAIDGQKQYVVDLEKAMRAYIQEHQTEFLPEGVEAAVIPDIEEEATTAVGVTSEEKHPTSDELKQRERERNARGLQWAWDTFDGAYQVAKRSTKGALELIKDAWDQSTSTTILWFLIVILVLSNLWTLMRMGSNKVDAARKLEARKVEEREKWVQSIVTALWEELAAGKDGSPMILQPPHHTTTSSSESQVAATPLTLVESVVPPSQQPVLPIRSVENLKEEIQQLRLTLQELEGKVLGIKDSLAGYATELSALD